MGRPKKTEGTAALVPSLLTQGKETPAGGAPTMQWLSLAKVLGGYAVLKASTRGHDVLGVEVLAGPMARGGASAALRVEMARAFLVGKGPK